jgi:hypothetical protein
MKRSVIMSRLMEMVEEEAHQRMIEVTTYKAGPGKVVVEGRLVDRRFRENFLITGEKRPVGEIHNMIVRLLVDIASLTIEDVEVNLVKVPREECSDLYDSLSVIKGLRISKGFTLKVKSLLGGVQSCAHLRELVEAMGPAVLQGVFSIMAQNESDLRTFSENPQMRKYFADSVVNSCHVWRQEGPELKKVLDLINDLHERKRMERMENRRRFIKKCITS